MVDIVIDRTKEKHVPDQIRLDMGLAFVQLLGRLTLEERRQFAKLVDLDELARLRTEKPIKRRVGEPRIYVGTTPSGLDIELPAKRAARFIERLTNMLSPRKIEIFIPVNGEHGEFSFSTTADFLEFLRLHNESLVENWSMIEFDDATLTSGGHGCFSLALEGTVKKARREIAQEALEICGIRRRFSADEFSAVMWDEGLEVRE